MPVNLQSKLLSVIEDKAVRRVGGTTTKPVNARIIAATNADLGTVLGRNFRKDLYYRLSVIRIHIPPLRERREDIPPLCSSLLKQIAGNRTLELPGQEIEKLVQYDWPGNVRELKNVLERALFVQKGTELRPSLLLEKSPVARPCAPSRDIDPTVIRTLEESEREIIRTALQQLSGNLTQTAKALGISLSTLKRKIKEYGLK